MGLNQDLELENYSFDLPSELIAQEPLKKRESCRLLLYDRKSRDIRHCFFENILGELKEGDVLVINTSKVIPCRLLLKKKTGSCIEVFVLKYENKHVVALMKPAKRLKVGDVLYDPICLDPICQLCDKYPNGQGQFVFYENVQTILDKMGQMPLPPYIRNQKDSKLFYQTVYADQLGSLAAPTAGLHFSKDLLSRLLDRGVQLAPLTLHIGLGTFAPLQKENFESHSLHPEFYDIPLSSLEMIEEARLRGKKVVCVGTTSLRSLETYYQKEKKNRFGVTDIFIYPPYLFKGPHQIVTNFHLPKSSLFLLISALMGRQEALRVYQIAIENGYRFYSYGDAMFIR